MLLRSSLQPRAPQVLLILLLLGVGVHAVRGPSGDRAGDLIGWMGETHRGPAKTSDSQEVRGEPVVEVLSWEPRAFLYHSFLSHEECDHLIQEATPRLTRSGVVDNDTGGSLRDKSRTSSGAFLQQRSDTIISEIERRIAKWTLINETQGEGLQILRYQTTEQYTEHYDYFFHEGANSNGGNRIATVLMYLSDVEEGGETVFPNADLDEDQVAHPHRYSECGMRGLAVKPRKGDALLFFSLKTTGELDAKSLHAGCPVISGTKWSATKWIHVAPVAVGAQEQRDVQHVVFTPPAPPVPPGCVDTAKMCSAWAMQGECEKNKPYMLGDPKYGIEGACLVSCRACHLMTSNKHEPHTEI